MQVDLSVRSTEGRCSSTCCCSLDQACPGFPAAAGSVREGTGSLAGGTGALASPVPAVGRPLCRGCSFSPSSTSPSAWGWRSECTRKRGSDLAASTLHPGLPGCTQSSASEPRPVATLPFWLQVNQANAEFPLLRDDRSSLSVWQRCSTAESWGPELWVFRTLQTAPQQQPPSCSVSIQLCPGCLQVLPLMAYPACLSLIPLVMSVQSLGSSSIAAGPLLPSASLRMTEGLPAELLFLYISHPELY